MKLNEKLEQYKEKNSLFSTCVLLQGKLYAFTSFMRIPVIGDLYSGKMILMPDLKDYDASFAADYMVSVGNEVFALEQNGNRLMSYNLDHLRCQYYNIACNKKGWGNYAAFIHYGNFLYIFPRYSDAIVKVNLWSKEIQRDKRLYSSIDILENHTYFHCGCQLKNTMWLFQRYGNLVVSYDLEKDTWIKHELSTEIYGCVHAVQYGNKIYILTSEGMVYSWDMNSEFIENVVDCSRFEMGKSAFCRIAVTDKTLFLLPSLANDILCADLSSGQVSKFNIYPPDLQNCGSKVWSKYYGYSEDENHYYFAMHCFNYILSINKRTGKAEWIKLKFPSYSEYIKTYIGYNEKLLDEEKCSIKDMICNLKDKSVSIQKEGCLPVGKKIWKQMNGLKE